jgi:hypothetical protein
MYILEDLTIGMVKEGIVLKVIIFTTWASGEKDTKGVTEGRVSIVFFNIDSSFERSVGGNFIRGIDVDCGIA